jgi:DNA-directed RNA polymerase specialized sigma24 family protein
VEWFLAAKKALRAHRDWSDEQVASHCGIPLAVADEIIRPARQEIEQDQVDPASRHAARMTGD